MEVVSIEMTVSDLAASRLFYTDTLPFNYVSTDGLTTRLRLGEETLLLHAPARPGAPIPPAMRSNDVHFQHLAIVVSDTEAATRRLAEHGVTFVSAGPQTLPRWNFDADAIRALYFRDPDGHFLELIQFPSNKGEPKWQRRDGRLFLGIDHTALVVRDLKASRHFYRDLLGLTIVGESLNYGGEQELLSGVPGARVKITGFRGVKGPGIELLQYEHPGTADLAPGNPTADDPLHWQVNLRSARLTAGPRLDPDGHALSFTEPAHDAPAFAYAREAFRQHWTRYLMEGAELGIFMIVALYLTIAFELPQSPLRQRLHSGLLRRFFVGFGIGLTVVALIYCPWGRQSGAQFNPSVTLARLSLTKIEPWDALFYILAQFLGGWLLLVLAGLPVRLAARHEKVKWVATQPGPAGAPAAFLAEFLISFLILFSLLLTIHFPLLKPWLGVIAGLHLCAFITFESPFSGMSLNPAARWLPPSRPGVEKLFGSTLWPRRSPCSSPLASADGWSIAKSSILQRIFFMRSLIFLLLVSLLVRSGTAAEPKAVVHWQPWSEAAFQRARAEKKLVLLDLGTSWCHWCHVMEEQTYADPAVVELLSGKYIALKVDADSRPDLANRYEDYGWPATIIYKWDGTELARRRGYIPPRPMASLLQAFIDDPTPGPSIEPERSLDAASEARLTPPQRTAMRESFVGAYDSRHGGWGDGQHYLDWNALEYCLTAGAAGDVRLAGMAQQTLTSGLKLIDPAWGGVYQYSTDGDWDHPHFEKIMPFQAENLRIFALASILQQEPAWLQTAQQIHSYLRKFLTAPEGAFYTSQDADLVDGEHGGEYFALDDAGRRSRGVPRLDHHLYARENGLAITGLCALYAASGDQSCLAEARRAADWVLAYRALPEGGFRHDEADAAGPYLGDSLAMARAFLALYTVTAERPWLDRAEQTAKFMAVNFTARFGFATAKTASPDAVAARPQLDENVMLVRFACLLYQHTGEASFQAMAEHALKYLSSPTLTESLGYGTSPVLLADLALASEPPHLVIAGSRADPAAQQLFATALRHLPMTSRIEWLDPQEKPPRRADVIFPPLTRAAALVCANGSCSAPIADPEKLAERLQKITHSGEKR